MNEHEKKDNSRSTVLHIEGCENGIVKDIHGPDTMDTVKSIKNKRVDITGVHAYPTPKNNALTAAIKNPSANDNKGWKIMVVGAFLAFVLSIVGMALYEFNVKPILSNKIRISPESNEVSAHD